MTLEYAMAIYRSSKAAVVTALLCLDGKLSALRDRISQDSPNNPKPPSIGGFRISAPKSLRKRLERKAGGQRGNRRSTLLPIASLDSIINRRVYACSSYSPDLSAYEADRI